MRRIVLCARNDEVKRSAIVRRVAITRTETLIFLKKIQLYALWQAQKVLRDAENCVCVCVV